MSVTRRVLLESGAAFTLAGAAFAQPAGSASFAPARDTALAAARDMLKSNDVPAISFALFNREGVIFAEAVGQIDKAAGKPAAPQTLFCIGSCSKVLAAAATLILVDRGKVELDAPFVRYVPEFRMQSPAFSDITVRMLLSHSSGLPGADYRGVFTQRWDGDYSRRVLRTQAGARLKHRPGDMSVYCNDGFTLLEQLIENVSGVPFIAFVEHELFAPLGMTSSRFANRAFEPDAYAPGYLKNRKQPLECVNPAASGGAYTTPAEMARFLALFLNGGRFGERPILSPHAITLMIENQTLRETLRPVPTQDGFGLGWDSVRNAAFSGLGMTALRKNGGTSVYATDMIVLPDVGLGVLATGSSGKCDSGRLAEHILLVALVDAKAIDAVPQPLADAAGPVAGDVDPRFSGGVFANHAGLSKFETAPDGSVSMLKYEPGGWKLGLKGLKPRKGGALASDDAKTTVLSIAEAQDKTYLVQTVATGMKHYTRSIPSAQRLPSLGAVSQAWRRRLGKTFVVVNEPASSLLLDYQAPIVELHETPDAPGYVVASLGSADDRQSLVVDATKDEVRALMCLQIPFNFGRDLNDVVVLEKDGDEWLSIGSSIYRPLDRLEQIGLGRHEVRIGADGYCEWRRLGAVAQISIGGCDHWRLFNETFELLAGGAGSMQGVAAPDAAFVWIDGAPGSTVQIVMTA